MADNNGLITRQLYDKSGQVLVGNLTIGMTVVISPIPTAAAVPGLDQIPSALVSRRRLQALLSTLLDCKHVAPSFYIFVIPPFILLSRGYMLIRDTYRIKHGLSWPKPLNT